MTRVRKLEIYYGRILGCRVVIELLQRHHHAGNRYHVRIDLSVPGEEIVIAHEAHPHPADDATVTKLTKRGDPHRDRTAAKVAIREAFEAARRRLQDFARRQRGAVKSHPRPANRDARRPAVRR